MRTLIMYGASDDLIEAEGVPGADEFSAHSRDDDEDGAEFALGGQMILTWRYTKRGVWSVEISQVDEDLPLPPWPVRISQHERGYSVQLEIDVPDGVALLEVR